MNSIKANSSLYYLTKQSRSAERKASDDPKKPDIKQKFNSQAFGASVHVKEGFAKKTLNFALNIVDKIQRHIETGGFIIEFLVVDFAGMVVPRVYQAYHRNEKELGHPNYAAAREEFTREILSGPSMFLIPMAFLLASKKMFGSASHVNTNTLNKFKEITGKIIKDNDNLPKNFYNKIVDTLYGSKINTETKKNIVEDFLKLHSAEPKEAKKLKAKITETLISSNQEIGNSKKLGISRAESSKIKFDKTKPAVSISDFVTDCRNYSSDVINVLSKAGNGATEQLVNEIHSFKEGARKLITTTAVATLSAFLFFVPKIYSQNKEYPGLAGLTGNSEKDNSQLLKEESDK
ncbi:MAG: hypothetical protein WCG23_10570 [bacterium]